MKIKRQGFALLCVATAQIPFGLTVPVAHAAAGKPVCMGAVTKGSVPGRSFTILVEADKASAMQSQGFVRQPCASRESNASLYREGMCRLAHSTPIWVQERFRETYRVLPVELCANAKSAEEE